MKSYTDIKQSKKLAKILPLENVDMCYLQENGQAKTISPSKLSEILNVSKPQVIPCWSLSALFDVLPDGTDVVKDKTDTENEKYMCTVGVKDDIISTFGNNPVDACYEMIIRLNELKLL